MTHLRAALALLTAACLAACGDFFQVESSARVPASQLDNPARAASLVQGAIADFECAFSEYVALSGTLVDEFYSSTSGANFTTNFDRRIESISTAGDTRACPEDPIQPMFGLWLPLSTARYQADDVLRRLEGWNDNDVPQRDSLIATAAAYAGYTYTVIGEGYCQASFSGGPIHLPHQVFRLAEERFDTAITRAQTAGNAPMMHMALVGRARARLDLAREADLANDQLLASQKRAEAAADARQVPPGFVRPATYSSGSTRRENQVFVLNQGFQRVSVDPRYRQLKVGGVPDPRVLVANAGRRGQDRSTPLWHQLKYPSASSPIRIASWEEAQLIIAEAEGGQEAVSRINAIRAKYPQLPQFSSADSAEIAREIVRERRAELWLEGHRLNDRLRLPQRLGIPPTVACPGCFTDAAQDSATLGLAWETGTTHQGRPFGNMTCIPLPSLETCNNPNIGCQ